MAQPRLIPRYVPTPGDRAIYVGWGRPIACHISRVAYRRGRVEVCIGPGVYIWDSITMVDYWDETRAKVEPGVDSTPPG